VTASHTFAALTSSSSWTWLAGAGASVIGVVVVTLAAVGSPVAWAGPGRPVVALAALPPPAVTAAAVSAYDLDAGQELSAKEADRRLPTGSTVKIATALVVVRHARLPELRHRLELGPAGAPGSEVGRLRVFAGGEAVGERAVVQADD